MHRRPGAADPLRPRMLVMAVAIAALGALQYAWNFRGLWAELEPPATLGEALAKFWFDVTKADWRETLVNTVSETGLQYRPAMYWFDLRQQFGVPGVALAAIGFCYVLVALAAARRSPPALLCGQPGVRMDLQRRRRLYLFSALALRRCAVRRCRHRGHCGAFAARVSNRTVATQPSRVILLLYPAWRGYDTFPAVDRSWDDRAEQLLDEFTAGTDGFPGALRRTPCLASTRTGKCRTRSSTTCASAGQEFRGLQRTSWNGCRRAIAPRGSMTLSARNAEIGRDVIVTERVTAANVMDTTVVAAAR